MSKGLGKRQREVLEKLEQHRDHPPDYNERAREAAEHHPEIRERVLRHCSEEYPEWMTVTELAGGTCGWWGVHPDPSDRASVYRAVRKLEALGLVETKHIWRKHWGWKIGDGAKQLGVRLV
jgi:hypothetical protein